MNNQVNYQNRFKTEKPMSMKNKQIKIRLCWTRQQLVQATGLSYRTIRNLESRGLLHRCLVGVNIALYTDESVTNLFADKSKEK
jgi:hypothetical protein